MVHSHITVKFTYVGLVHEEPNIIQEIWTRSP